MSYQYPFNPGHSSMPATPQTSYRWDDGDPHQLQHQQRLEQQPVQQPLHHQPEQNDDVVQFQEHVPVVPSQENSGRPGSSHVVEGDEPRQRLQHVSVPALLQPEHMRPLMIDTNRAYHGGASASPSSGPPSAGTSGAFHGTIGPMRARISPVHSTPRTAAHPYRRPQSAAGVVIARSRREPDGVQSVRQASSSSVPARQVLSETATTATISSGFHSAAKMVSTTSRGLINPPYSPTGTTFLIRTDLHFNSETSVLTALCELPGCSKSDITVVLSTNVLNRVKQVVVTAKPPQVIADDGYVVRERKSGSVSRTFVVPSETTPDHLTVEMRDGLLSLKIQCPPPSADDDSQEIMIR